MIDWPVRRLGDPDVCVLNPRKSEVADIADNTTVSFVPMAQIDDATGTMDATNARRIGEVRRGYTYFAEGDVVFAKITPCMENGKSAIARNLENGIGFGTTELHILRPGPLALADWIHLFVRSGGFRDKAKYSMQGGAGQQRVPIDFIQESEIPVPPLDEQRRIVDRIGEMSRRVDEARRLTSESKEMLDELLKSLYSRMIEDVLWKALKEVASLVRRSVSVKPNEEYEEMGVRSFGKGTFKKPVLTGRQIGNKRIYYIHSGDLVFNNVFAWEGAIAVATTEDHNRVGSHRFITYVPHKGLAISEFLCHHFLSEGGIQSIRAASPGSAGRNRTLGLKKLEKIVVPVPSFDEQRRFSALAQKRRLIRMERAKVAEEVKAFNISLLAKALGGDL